MKFANRVESFFAIFALFFALNAFAAPNPVDTEKYLVNPGDVLDISVWNEDALKREVRVLPDGSIGFPLTGTIMAAGKTIDTLKKEMTEKLKEYIAEPVVNIAVKAAEGNVIYVTGQVKNPGKFVMNDPMNVMQALSLAGGLTPFAEEDDIVILRKTNTGNETIRFEYSGLESGDNSSKNHVLKSGDVIVVP
jgi:polysaccharide biosynthesis/export protein